MQNYYEKIRARIPTRGRGIQARYFCFINRWLRTLLVPFAINEIRYYSINLPDFLKRQGYLNTQSPYQIPDGLPRPA